MFRYEISLLTLVLVLIGGTAFAQPGAGHGPGRGAGPALSAADLDGDGVVSRSEFDQWSGEMFGKLDGDGDGVLSEDEQVGPRHRERARERQHRFSGGILAHAADSDQDRLVTTSEWTAFLATLESDADGVVDPASLAAALPEPPGRADRPGAGFAPEPRIPREEMLLRFLDTDGDQAIELTELEAIFAGLDSNGDGELSEDEIPRPRHRGHRGPRGSRRGF